MLHVTPGNISIEYEQHEVVYKDAIIPLLAKLDMHRGALFASGVEYPGRYTCWDIGFYNPPLVLTCRQTTVTIQALNSRGDVLLPIFSSIFDDSKHVITLAKSPDSLTLTVKKSEVLFSEEQRTRQPSIFNIIREILAFFHCETERYIGLYGAFGYDLIEQFEAITHQKPRVDEQRDFVLYLPDELYIVDHRKEQAFIRRYEFTSKSHTTKGLPRTGASTPYVVNRQPEKGCDHAMGEYAAIVELAKERFATGDLFEVVPSQTFYAKTTQLPSELFLQMRKANPSPYGFFINLGEEEYLVGASPEMYVRVQGRRVETCPISGTIARGVDAMEDAMHIQRLLDSEKECSELTMCTDVDRNDKSRICEAGSVKVIGRRQIEMYSRLIHTVDHIEGILREDFDAVDAFLTHMWVVTVTGSPKNSAMSFIEKYEKSPRRWYGGAVGWFGFNGDLNTGLTLRTCRVHQGIAEIRVGATLLFDSVAADEEAETRLKAAAFLALFDAEKSQQLPQTLSTVAGKNKRILLVDNQDSFVHTLANYCRQTGAQVETVRYNHALKWLENHPVDVIILSPGPGRPADFNLAEIIKWAIEHHVPLFGVCLGLQGIVEYFGGELSQLDYPMHGKPSEIHVLDASGLFEGMGESFVAGRYHSLYAARATFPDELTITAETADKIVMAISHKTLPIHAVQFHPETILSLHNQAGLRIINRLMAMV